MKNYDPVDVLIVEDNPTDSELMIRALKKHKLANDLFVVEDGVAALDFVFGRGDYKNRQTWKPPRMIFLDLKLPKLNGLEVLKEIKSHPDTRKLPVVIVSSSKEDPDIKAAYDLGANGYVVKPVDFSRFAKAMQNTGLYWLLVNEMPR